MRGPEETSSWFRQRRSLSSELIHSGVDVIGLAQIFKQWQQVKELRVVRIIEPRNHRNLRETTVSQPAGILTTARASEVLEHSLLILSGTHSVVGVEDVGGRRVVQDQSLVKVSAQAAQVLHVATLVEYARLPEQSRPEHAALVQEVRHWVCILMEGGTSVPAIPKNIITKM